MTGRKPALGSNLERVDARVITAKEYEEIPELTDAWFAAAGHHRGGKLTQGKTFTLLGHAFESSARSAEIFIFCASRSYDEDRREKFAATACVEIFKIGERRLHFPPRPPPTTTSSI